MSCETILQVKSHMCYWQFTETARKRLSDRWQHTHVGSCLSEPSIIVSGVLQGSCIGPLLFLLCINSLTTVLENNITCVLFADDVKMYTICSNV